MSDYYDFEMTFPCSTRVLRWAKHFGSLYGISDEISESNRLTTALEMPVVKNDGHFVYRSIDQMAGMYFFAFVDVRPFTSLRMNALVGLLAAVCVLLQNGFDFSPSFEKEHEIDEIIAWINGIRTGNLDRDEFVRSFQSMCVPLDC